MDTYRLAFEAPTSIRKQLDKLPHGMRKTLFLSVVDLIFPLIEKEEWNKLHAIEAGRGRLEVDDEHR